MSCALTGQQSFSLIKEPFDSSTSLPRLARASLPVVEESASVGEEDKEQAKMTEDKAKSSESKTGPSKSDETTSTEAAGESTTRKPHPLIR